MSIPGITQTPRALWLAPWLGVLLLAISGCAGAGPSRNPRAAARLRTEVPALLHQEPRRALLYAVDAAQLDPSVASRSLLLSVDSAFPWVQRVLAPLDRATVTAVGTGRVLLSADRDGHLSTWGQRTGRLLATVTVTHPIHALAASPSPYLAASLDAQGRLSLWDLEQPAAPIELPIRAASIQAHVVALGFSAGATELIAVTDTGIIARYDLATRQPLPSRRLGEVSGTVPWRRRSSSVPVAAAEIVPEVFGPDTSLLVATPHGGVLRVDLDAMRAQTVVPAHDIDGTPTAIAESRYDQPNLVIGTSTGITQWTSTSHSASSENTGPTVGLALSESSLTAGSAQGITSARYTTEAGLYLPAFAGRPARALSGSPGGPVEVATDGSISEIETEESALALKTVPVEASTIAQFGAEGNLLETVGSQPSNIEKLVAVHPGQSGYNGTETVPNRVIHTYAPAKAWWPESGNRYGWYVNSAELGSKYVVAGGQDPTGTAVVLVWDARTGAPIHRLALGTSAVPSSGQDAGVPPAIVSQVQILPAKHLIAAYSALQGVIVFWSTDTWRPVSSVYVGPVANFSVSPDEARLLITSPSDEVSGAHVGNSTTRLLFVDIATGKTEREVPSPASELAGFAPDGRSIVEVQKGAVLRRVATDGRHVIGKPVSLETGQPRSLVWQPNSDVVAVAMSGGGVRLADLDTGQVTVALPAAAGVEPVALSFSPDGRLLAASNGTSAQNRLVPAPPTIWTLGQQELQARACALAGGPPSPSEWAAWAAPAPYKDPCASAAVRAALPAHRPAPHGFPAAAVYRSGEDVDVVSPTGETMLAGHAGQSGPEPVSFSWSGAGDLAWTSGSLVHVVTPTAIASAPCGCSGVVIEGASILALEKSGDALVRFPLALTGAASRLPVRGLPRYQPTLLAASSGRAIVVGFDVMQQRNTPSEIYEVSRFGRVRRIGSANGDVFRGAAVSPSGTEVAMAASLSGGACYSPEHVVLVDLRTGRLSFPAMPAGVEGPIVRSLSWSPAGTLEAAIAPTACGAANPSPNALAEAHRYQLLGGHFTDTGATGYDSQQGALLSGTLAKATLTTELTGTLQLRGADGRIVAAPANVSAFSVRP